MNEVNGMQTNQALQLLFGYQRIEQNQRLQRLIDSALEDFSHPRELSEDETEIWAAGEAERSFYDPYDKHND